MDVCGWEQRVANESVKIRFVKQDRRSDRVRRQSLARLDDAISEAKRLAVAVRTLETTDPLTRLRKSLRERYGPASQPHLAADDSE